MECTPAMDFGFIVPVLVSGLPVNETRCALYTTFSFALPVSPLGLPVHCFQFRFASFTIGVTCKWGRMSTSNCFSSKMAFSSKLKARVATVALV